MNEGGGDFEIDQVGQVLIGEDDGLIPARESRHPSISISNSLVSLKKRRVPRSILTSTIELCNTILGTGIVSLPYAFSTVGLGLGTIFVLLAVWTTWFSLRMLVTSAQKAHGNPSSKFSFSLASMKGEPSFSSIGQVTFSVLGSVICDGVVVIACIGFAISYIVSIGECMPVITQALLSPLDTGYDILTNRYFWMFGKRFDIFILYSLYSINIAALFCQDGGFLLVVQFDCTILRHLPCWCHYISKYVSRRKIKIFVFYLVSAGEKVV